MLLAVDKVSCEASNAAVDVLHHNNVPLSIESIAVGPPQPCNQYNHSREQMTSVTESFTLILMCYLIFTTKIELFVRIYGDDDTILIALVVVLIF